VEDSEEIGRFDRAVATKHNLNNGNAIRAVANFRAAHDRGRAIWNERLALFSPLGLRGRKPTQDEYPARVFNGAGNARLPRSAIAKYTAVSATQYKFNEETNLR
jgi:hypothetical protein